jgi:hypothetical protein
MGKPRAPRKPRSKRTETGELVARRCEQLDTNQAALVAHLGADGAAMARQRAAALLEGGWGACWSEIG